MRGSLAFSFLLVLAFALTACSQSVKIKAVHPAMTGVESTVTTINSGTVDAEQQAILAFGVQGRVSRIFVHAGDRVKEGELLAEQENADLKIIYDEASKEMHRVNELWKDKLVSRVAYDDARKALEVAKANYDKSVIRAPFDGIITEVNLRVGEPSGPQTAGGKPPMRIVDTKPRLVKGDIDEIDLAKVKVGQTARIRIPAARKGDFKAQVSRVVPFVDTTKEQDRTSQIELRLDSADATVPVGASAEIEIVTDQKQSALALPTRAIFGSGKARYVFVVSQGKLLKTGVQTGMGNYDRTEILSGVATSDLVALPSDDTELKQGLKVSAEVVPWP